ncbi:MAG: T9SS type A sorting domain-containing protein [Bacteroidota bacterium]
MKHFFTFIFVVAFAAASSGQIPATSPQLVTGNSDVIGMDGFPSNHQFVQSGPNSFYWVGGASGRIVNHPMLPEVYNDFANIYFIKYDEHGNPLSSNYIRGTSSAIGAFSYNGGMTIVGGGNTDVEADGKVYPINNANRMEFLAQYNDQCQIMNLVPVWDLGPSLYPYSQSAMDQQTGDIYLAGTSYQPFNVAGYGVIGEEWQDYFYVLKFNRNLDIVAVFTAGFDDLGGTEYGRYSNITLVPDGFGNVVVAGTYEGDRTPVIAGDILPSMGMASIGAFAYKLDGGMKKVWGQEGTFKGGDYGDRFDKGMAMQSGDVVLTGTTTTGYFSLGATEVVVENGMDIYSPMALRITPDGKVAWIHAIHSAVPYYVESSYYGDATMWNDDLLYITGQFEGDNFMLSGEVMTRELPEGIFVTALDMASGEEQWGYALSSNFISGIRGFDVDASGNLTLMGDAQEAIHFDGLDPVSVAGSRLVFHLGLDYDGNPLWENTAYLKVPGYSLYGYDLEVLRDGEVFSTTYKSVADPMLIGGSEITSKDIYSVMLVALDVDNALGGTVRDRSGAPVYPGLVKAYKTSWSGAYPVVDSIMLNESGGYLFEGLYPAGYMLLVVPDAKMYPDGLPTYLGDVTAWNDNTPLSIAVDTKATFMDITLVEIKNPTPADGSGEMLGNVSYADDIVGTKGTKGKPYKKASILLVKKAVKKSTLADTLIAYVETDDLGDYVFENVPDGAYTLYVDIPGLPMAESYDVVIQGNKIIYGLDFEVGDEEIITTGTVDVESVPATADRLSIFPNPGNGLLYIDLPATGDYRIRIYNTVGKLVDSKEALSTAGLFRMDVSGLQDGIYLIKIEGRGRTEVTKYIKR